MPAIERIERMIVSTSTCVHIKGASEGIWVGFIDSVGAADSKVIQKFAVVGPSRLRQNLPASKIQKLI